jgi:hypothetical protein
MNEQEGMDRFLREAMAGDPPRLSTDFDARLARSLRRRAVNSKGRQLIAAYAVAALTSSVLVMRSASLHWSLIAIALLVPLAVVATMYRPHLAPES